jgi:hypothetical protein
MFGIIKPSGLRGKFGRHKYFEGWFQKVYSVEHNASFIVIYGYATQNAPDKFGFIQIYIPRQAPHILYFNKDEISCDPRNHSVWMGDNLLTTKSMNIASDDISLKLAMKNNHPIPTFKNSMGYAYYVPTLPCYHSVMNVSHHVSGEIHTANQSYQLEHELGYMEKNWGTSFPKRYCWLQAVDPLDSRTSLLFSQAEIDWIGSSFLRHVGHLRFDGKHIDLRELRKCTISNSILDETNHSIQLSGKNITLEIHISFQEKVIFKGPTDGNMSRDIIHHTDARIQVMLNQHGSLQEFTLVGNYENLGLFQ